MCSFIGWTRSQGRFMNLSGKTVGLNTVPFRSVAQYHKVALLYSLIDFTEFISE